FKLGRTGEGTLDAVTHGRDFAPDGLTDGDNGLAGDGFRLREAHCHFGHRFRDHAHVLRAIEHMSEHKEKDDGHHECADNGKHGGKAEFCRPEYGLRIDRIERGNADDSPDKSGDAGGDIGAARWTVAQRLENLPDTDAVIIGGAAWRGTCLRSIVWKK